MTTLDSTTESRLRARVVPDGAGRPASDRAPVPEGDERGAPRPRLRDWLNLLGLVALWGSAFTFNKIALSGFSPGTVVAARLVLGAMVMGVVLAMLGRRLPRDRAAWGSFALLALVGNIVPFTLIAWGQARIDAGLAGILMAVMPLVVIALAHLFVPGERMTRLRAAGFALGFVGVVLLLGPSVAPGIFTGDGGGVTSLAGQLAVLGGAVFYGINVILARLSPVRDATVTTAGVMLLASVMALPGLALAPPELPFPLLPSVAVVVLGVLATGAATVLYFHIVNTAGASFLSLINYLIPAWAAVLASIALGEDLRMSSLAALAVILAGVWLSQRRRRAA